MLWIIGALTVGIALGMTLILCFGSCLDDGHRERIREPWEPRS